MLSYRLLTILSLAGAVISVFSVYEHVLFVAGVESATALCNLSAEINCAGAIKSKWSTFLGVPIGAFGVAYYLSFCIISLVTPNRSDEVRARVISGLTVVAFVSLLLSIFLFYVSKTYIGSVCPVCFGLYTVSILVFSLLLMMEPQLGKGERMDRGFRELFLLPKTLFVDFQGRTPEGNNLLRRTMFGVIVVCALSYVFPGHLLSLVASSSNEKQAKQAEQKWKEAESTEIPSDPTPGLTQDYVKGPQDAPVRIVEFFDYECPACRDFYFVLDRVLKEYPEKVSVEYRNYPLDQGCNPGIQHEFHKHACLAAEVSRCAGEQGKFFEAVGHLMALKELDHGDEAPTVIDGAILRTGKALNLDGEAFRECLSSDRHIPKLQSDIEIADKLGLRGTPSVWINGRKIEQLRFQAIKKVVDRILTEKAG